MKLISNKQSQQLNSLKSDLQPYLIDATSKMLEAADNDGKHGLAQAFGAIKRNIPFHLNQHYNSSHSLELWEFEKIVEDTLIGFNGSKALKNLTSSHAVSIFKNAIVEYQADRG